MLWKYASVSHCLNWAMNWQLIHFHKWTNSVTEVIIQEWNNYSTFLWMNFLSKMERTRLLDKISRCLFRKCWKMRNRDIMSPKRVDCSALQLICAFLIQQLSKLANDEWIKRFDEQTKTDLLDVSESSGLEVWFSIGTSGTVLKSVLASSGASSGRENKKN